MSSGGGGNTTTKQEPWGQQVPYLLDLFERAQALSRRPVGAYGGQTVAPLTPLQQQAIDRAHATAAAQNQLANTASQYATALMRPATFADAVRQMPPGLSERQLLNVGSNPYVRDAARAATRPLYQQLAESVLPAVRGESLASGFYGSNRQGIAEGLAAGRTAQAAGDATSRIYADAYGQGLNNLTAQRGQTLGTAAQIFGDQTAAGSRALALAPTIQSMRTAPLNTLSAAGTMQRNYQQALLNDAVNRFYYEQGLPFQQLAQYQQLIQGGYGGSATQQQPSQNPLLAAAGGALMGGALGGMLPFAAAGPIGAGAGALLSLLM